MKKYDFFSNRKINYIELDDEIKAEIGVLGGLDIFTDAHVKGVVDITTKICDEMKMPYQELKKCILCAYLHDVGKIYIPSEILQKTAKLTPEEYEIMKTHAALGYDVCMQNNEFRHLAPIVRAHHESFDGSGYPDGLKGNEIPYEASLIKVADVYDALTRKRQYKEGFRQSDAIKIMIEEVENKKMCAKFLYFLVFHLLKEIMQNVENQYNVINLYEEEIETLHDLEDIYKEIYDRGYTKALKKKLERYNLEPGYDMSVNAQLLIAKQHILERERSNYEILLEEEDKIKKQLKYLKKLYKDEKWYVE